MIRKIRLRYIILISYLVILIFSNLGLFLFFNNNSLFTVPHDSDRLPSGNTLITTSTFLEMINTKNRIRDQIPIEANHPGHKLLEVNSNGDIVWEFIGLAIPHEVEVLPNGHLLVADTQYDRIIEIDYPEKNIVWSWEPAQINWTQVNEEWDADHYYNSPINENNETIYDWTHINDVDYKENGNWSSTLISLRNFDLIVEVNYTADFNDPNNPNNIIWWYGEHENFSFQQRQHNPDFLSNGNIVISDSGNDRIIEVNYSTKEIVWEYKMGLKWPRDADELDDGNMLITDSNGNRIIIINRTSKEIIWSYTDSMIIPYEADFLDNGNILISTAYNGLVIEVDWGGNIVWKYGRSYIERTFYMNSGIVVLFSAIVLFFNSKILFQLKTIPTKKKNLSIAQIVAFAIFLIIGTLIMSLPGRIISFLVRSVYNLFGPSLY